MEEMIFTPVFHEHPTIKEIAEDFIKKNKEIQKDILERSKYQIKLNETILEDGSNQIIYLLSMNNINFETLMYRTSWDSNFNCDKYDFLDRSEAYKFMYDRYVEDLANLMENLDDEENYRALERIAEYYKDENIDCFMGEYEEQKYLNFFQGE